MKKIIFSVILLFSVVLYGCVSPLPNFTEVKLEKDYIDYKENFVINFGIVNNGQTSFNPKIEVFNDDPEKCFDSASKDLEPILPGKKIIDSISISSKNNVDCKNNEFVVFLVLKDKNSGDSITKGAVTLHIKG